MYDVLDLRLTLSTPPQEAPSEVVASIALRCDAMGLSYEGDLLKDPLTPREREELRWYLEEYTAWPFDYFRERAQRIEGQLGAIGKRLYDNAFCSVAAHDILQSWRLERARRYQISIVSSLPRALSLPWELLHDAQGFLVMRSQLPVSIIRTLPQQRELPSHRADFRPPLRILLVVARPEGVGFIDHRGVARELLAALENQIEAGTIEVEFLRPPTLHALRTRLGQIKHPVHVLHFDGHGAFDQDIILDFQNILHMLGSAQGKLDFEDEDGNCDSVSAERLRQVLQGSSVSLVVLNACKSAQAGEDDAFSSVAGQLIQGGQDAVVAMSASILVASATRYVRAFYMALAEGIPAPIANERARQFLDDDRRRHLLSRVPDKEAERVELHDWWVPHFYQQRSLTLRPGRQNRKRTQFAETYDLPKAPRYGFSERARELHKIERALLHEQLVLVYGFGGVGKTILARETAMWLTQTGMYSKALFVSFEHGGDASTLLSKLGHLLGVYEGGFDPNNRTEALAKLAPALKQQRLLLVADNLESLLPGGETPLLLEERLALWETLLALAAHQAGVILTCRDPQVGDGWLEQSKAVAHVALGGLHPPAAYQLASDILKALEIDRTRVPYADLCKLLKQLDYNPLAIQLVLPVLRTLPLGTIQDDFAVMLSQFAEDTEAGRNRSLIASLEYSMQRLGDKQRAMLPRLALFEGGVLEEALIGITSIPQDEWASLSTALEQAGLLTKEQIHEDIAIPFLRFHPVLIPFLRSQAGAHDPVLYSRFTDFYRFLANTLHHADDRHSPQAVRALAGHELPNLWRTLGLLLEAGEQDATIELAENIAWFLEVFGRRRELENLRRRTTTATSDGEPFTQSIYLRDKGAGDDAFHQGRFQAAYDRFTRLLERIEALPEGVPLGQGSFEHCLMLSRLAQCLIEMGQPAAAEKRIGEALAILEPKIQDPLNPSDMDLLCILLAVLGTAQSMQGYYAQARETYEKSLWFAENFSNTRQQGSIQGHLGMLAFRQQNYAEARARYLSARNHYQALGEPAKVAGCWHQLGMVAVEEEQFAEAERCFRNSLALAEQLYDEALAAKASNQLATVALLDNRPIEAEGWYRRALEVYKRIHPHSLEHAMILANLANLLVNEAHMGHTSPARLREARGYAEQSWTMLEPLGAPAEPWKSLSLLARIAELEGRTAAAREYWHRERKTYAAFVGNRHHVDRQFGQLIHDIVEVARGNTRLQVKVETTLAQLEANGRHIAASVRRIWDGERDWQALAEGLDRNGALLILRILETLAQPQTAGERADGDPS